MALRKKRRGIHLVQPKLSNSECLLQEAMAKTFKTGEVVPYSGIYQVTHGEHRLPHEVTLLRANSFPPCSKCGNIVTFTLLRAVTIDCFSVTLNAIPELSESRALSAVADEDDAGKAS